MKQLCLSELYGALWGYLTREKTLFGKNLAFNLSENACGKITWNRDEKHAHLAPVFGEKRFEHSLYNNYNDGLYEVFVDP